MKSAVVTPLKSIPTSHNQLGTPTKKLNTLFNAKRVVTQYLCITWDSNQRIQCTMYLRSENLPFFVVFHNVPRRKILYFIKKWLNSVITDYLLQRSTLHLMMDYAKQKKNQTINEMSQHKFKEQMKVCI